MGHRSAAAVLTLLRHLLAILILPFVVVVLVPRSLLRGSAAGIGAPVPDSFTGWLGMFAGAILMVLAFALFAWCVSLFARVGRGTLAPWDPTRELVAAGPYRHVRNPMITGVLLMLLGEALFWRSRAVCVWAAIFLGFNHFYFLGFEEPGLEQRFGEPYRVYKANVPRWIPRWRPWPADGP